MDDYLTLTDDQLKAKRNNVHRLRLAAEQEAERYELIEDEIWTEMKRRKLEAFWQKHPGLRLEVGDKLSVTPSLIAEKDRCCRQGHTYPLGEVYEVTGVYPHDDPYTVRIEEFCRGISSTSVTLDIAREMRQAFLDREAAK